MRWCRVLVVAVAFTIVLPVLAPPAASDNGPAARYVVTFAPGVAPSGQASAVENATGDDGERIDPDSVVVDATAGEAKELASDSRVAIVERDGIARAAIVPDDPCFDGGGDCPAASSGQVALRRVGGPLAWDVTTGPVDPAEVVVAVIDSGVDPTHPDFGAQLTLVSPAGCSSLIGTADDQTIGHGTRVAGVIAATGDNAIGIAGVAWDNVAIRSYKVLDSAGTGSIADVAGAIDCARLDGVDIINLSLEIGTASTFLQDAVIRAANAGIVMVAAAGNNGQANSSNVYPAAYSQVIAVASVDSNDRRATFSNAGSWVDIAAPGTSVLSTTRVSLGSYGTANGTSFSVPLVTGAATLVLARSPNATPAQVRGRLENTAQPLPVPAGLGRGMLDVGNAVRFPLAGAPQCAAGTAGWLLDGWGGLHPFGGAPAASGAPYWPGWDIARDVTTTPAQAGGYLLDGWGGVHRFGGAPSVSGSDYWQGWDIARAVARRPDGGVYVLDGWGGVHLARPAGSTVTRGAGGPYWPGFDIGRDIAVDPTNPTRGWVLDGWGGIHPFGGAPAVVGGRYTQGRDIARRLVVNAAGTGGWMLDAEGRMHPFRIGGGAMPAPIGGATFPIGPGRGVAADSAGNVVLGSAYGAVVPAGSTPCAASMTWPAWDIGRAVAVIG